MIAKNYICKNILCKKRPPIIIGPITYTPKCPRCGKYMSEGEDK